MKGNVTNFETGRARSNNKRRTNFALLACIVAICLSATIVMGSQGAEYDAADTYAVTSNPGTGVNVEYGSEAMEGVNYVFAVSPLAGYAGSINVSITIGGTIYMNVVKNGNSYTIPAADVTGAIVIATSNLVETSYPVTFDKGAGSTITGNAIARANEDYEFNILLEYGYSTTVVLTVTIGGSLYPNSSLIKNSNDFTIPGADITGAVLVKTGDLKDLSVQVNFDSDEGITINGATRVAFEENYTYSVNSGLDGKVEVTVKKGDTVLEKFIDNGATYSIAWSKVEGSESITISAKLAKDGGGGGSNLMLYIIIVIVIIVAVLALIWFFFLRGGKKAIKFKMPNLPKAKKKP